MSIDEAPAAAPKGEPEILLREPLVEFIASTSTFPPVKFVTYKKFPFGAILNALGPTPTEKGEPLTSLGKPVEALMAKAEMLLVAKLAT